MENRILKALPGAEFERLATRLQKVHIKLHFNFYRAGVPIEYVYFPESALGSDLVTLSDGSAMEVATVGREGMIGLPVVLGSDKAVETCVCQVPGEAWKLPAVEFKIQIDQNQTLKLLLNRYTQAFISMVSQSVICNRAHAIAARCARWLLMTHDRVGSNEFSLTHEYLAVMLGVRRAGVTLAMGALQKEGLILYHRGVIKVLNRKGLEASTCECYHKIRAEIDRLVPP